MKVLHMESRPVRICIVMENGEENPIHQSIKRIFKFFGESFPPYYFVKTTVEADMVIFEDVWLIEKKYSFSKTYLFFDTWGYRKIQEDLPSNMTDMMCVENIVSSLIELSHKTWSSFSNVNRIAEGDASTFFDRSGRSKELERSA